MQGEVVSPADAQPQCKATPHDVHVRGVRGADLNVAMHNLIEVQVVQPLGRLGRERGREDTG